MWRVPVSRAHLDDAGMTLLFLGLGIAIHLTGLGRIGDDLHGPGPDWFPLLTLGIGCAFQLLRSTHPAIALAGVTAALVLDTVTVPSIPVWLVFSDIVYAAAVHGSARLLRVLYGVCTTVSAAVLVLVAASPALAQWRLLFVCVLWLLALVGSPLAYGLAVRTHRSALALERNQSRILAELADHERAEAVADERRRLARELHDVIAGRLSAIAVQSAAALRYPDNDALARKALAAVRTNSVDALTEMRGMIDLLADTADADAPAATRETAGLRRLDRLVAPIVESGTDVEIDCPPWITDADTVDALPPVADIAAHRILAESLTNAVTHAPGQPIRIVITHADATLRLQITNPVPTPAPDSVAPHAGRGLANMTVRAGLVGGTLDVVRTDGDFTVTAILPAARTATSHRSTS
ncbi:histidine kinase [Gordonia sp. NB41Y]|uniref:sensor histidine kinase n=1 Tax=Gordonia sp. NB41Y TaxID=875808 RepID=UPI0006B1458A|nr:histidine kinase [Gordonia sp. NB41Y]KOY49055.1 histidine kinase [Gordonia sp. NB41Y]WLP92758.1 histidine kinase [Gordonia sp. NB41Y]